MTEKIDLGNKRLSVSQAFGSEFVSILEEAPAEGESWVVRQVRDLMILCPGINLIGGRVEKGTGFSGLREILCQQMGLPEGSKLGAVKDRLHGREKDFLLVVDGTESLSARQQKKLAKKVGKLGILMILE